MFQIQNNLHIGDTCYTMDETQMRSAREVGVCLRKTGDSFVMEERQQSSFLSVLSYVVENTSVYFLQFTAMVAILRHYT